MAEAVAGDEEGDEVSDDADEPDAGADGDGEERLGILSWVLTKWAGRVGCLQRLASNSVMSVASGVVGLHSVVMRWLMKMVSSARALRIAGSVDRLISIVNAFLAMGYCSVDPLVV